MALIKCPECGREISDVAAACPLCGFPIVKSVDAAEASAPVSQAVRKAELGEAEKRSGCGPSALGIMFLVFGLPALIFLFPAGALMIAAAIFCFVMAGRYSAGIRKGVCPYCGKGAEVYADSETYKCRFCQKVSTVKDDSLVTIE